MSRLQGEDFRYSMSGKETIPQHLWIGMISSNDVWHLPQRKMMSQLSTSAYRSTRVVGKATEKTWRKKNMINQVQPKIVIPCQKSGCLNDYCALQGQPLPIGITFCGVDYPRILNIPSELGKQVLARHLAAPIARLQYNASYSNCMWTGMAPWFTRNLVPLADQLLTASIPWACNSIWWRISACLECLYFLRPWPQIPLGPSKL